MEKIDDKTDSKVINFDNYMDTNIPLEESLNQIMSEIKLAEDKKKEILAFLSPLKIKDISTYEHSLRVGILSYKIAKVLRIDEKALLYSGLLHDLGKVQTDINTLRKAKGWSQANQEEVQKHVLDGYRTIRGKFDFTAEVIVRHHEHQKNSYPSLNEIPQPLHQYSDQTKKLIEKYSAIVSLADCFDALHRRNDKFGGTSEEIKSKILTDRPDQKQLIEDLYSKGIFK